MVRIVIVGASSGIGLAVAREFAKRGVRVGLAARRIEALASLQEEYPEHVEYAAIDINNADAPRRLDELIDRLGGMDIYFHVAGIGYDNPELDPRREVNILETNVCGFARMVSAAYGYFRQSGRCGRIAALTSVAGTNGIGSMAAYSASKRCAQTYLVALEQLARTEKVDVCFTDIRPGWTRTPLLKQGHAYPLEMELDYVVPQVIKAIVRHPRVAVIDWRWQLVISLWRCLPNALWTRLHLPVS